MPRLKIIILERTAPETYRYALWADVPAARQPFYAINQASAVSSWKDALPEDLAALRNGSITEKIDSIQVGADATFADVQALLQSRWTDWQAAVTARNDWPFYGTTWAGTTWANGGVL